MKKLRLFCFLFCLLIVENLSSQQNGALAVVDSAGRLNLAPYCDCRTDLSDTISFDLLYRQADGFRHFDPEEAFEPSKRPVWLKCNLPLARIPSGPFFLTVGIFDEITFYMPSEEGKIITMRTGRMIRPEDRAYQGFPYAFAMDSSELTGSQIFFRIKNDLPLGHPKVHPELYGKTSFHRFSARLEADMRNQHFVFGLLGGTFLAFSFFPIAYFVFNRKRYFLYYSVYILLSFIFVCFTFERFGHMDLIFSQAPGLMEHLETPLNSFSIIFYFLFLRSFLDAREKAPLLHWALGFLVVYQLTFQVLDLFVFKLMFNNYNVAYDYAALGTIPGLLICLYLLITVIRWKKADATFIGIGMAFFLAGVVLSILEFEGQIPSRPYSLFNNHHILFQFGIVLELFFFSFALSHRNRSTVLARMEAQARLRHLEELDQAKGRFFTNITHEFRTPLQVILGVVEQIRKNPKLQLKKRLHLIRNNGQNLLSMVNQMLDLTKLETGHFKLQPVQGDIIFYLKYLADSCRSAAADKNLTVDFESDLQEFVMDYDPECLKQIVYNLLSNAIRFTPDGGMVQLVVGSSQVTVGEELHTTNRLWLKVKDNGVGMDETTRTRIFDRFYSSEYMEKGQRGTGIGLALVKELVALMNGKISLESQKGKGTTFTIALPVTRSARKVESAGLTGQAPNMGPAESEPTAPVSEQKKLFPTVKTGRELLLIIEDSQDVRYYLRSLLAGSFQIVEAADGKQGMAKALRLIPDLIISDIMMPGADGYQLCKTLKTDPRTSHIPIILLTAKATDQDKIAGLRSGADGYLYKPINEQELFLRLSNLSALRKKIQEKNRRIDQIESIEPEASDGEAGFLKRLHRIVLENLEDEHFGPKVLCKELGTSRTQLYRKLKALTDLSLARYIRSVRLHVARKLLETTQLSIGEIAFKVGFKDQSYFTKTFSREFSMTPSQLRQK